MSSNYRSENEANEEREDEERKELPIECIDEFFLEPSLLKPVCRVLREVGRKKSRHTS